MQQYKIQKFFQNKKVKDKDLKRINYQKPRSKDIALE